MLLRTSLVRFLRSIRLSRCHDEIMRKKWNQGWSRFRLPIMRNGDFDFTRRITRNLSSMFCCDYNIKIERRTMEFSDRIKEKKTFVKDALETILIFARVLVIGSIITAVFTAYLITRLICTDLFPIILRKSIEFLGPIFIKFGQWISTRRDIFPENICDTLSGLQHNVTPHSWQYTEHLLKATYGSSWQDLFVKINDEELIGSGCCAQVYKAWIDLNAGVTVEREPQISHFVEILECLNLGHFVEFLDKALDESDELAPIGPSDGKLQPVAVKVLHPGIKDQLKRDITIMHGLCKCATYLIPELYWLSLTDCIDEFARLMEDQVDMQVEAANLVKFSANFSGRNNIIFPYPYMHLTHREILVESFHEGSLISDYLEHDDVILQKKLAQIGIAAVFKMVFKDNFIHCDLHPGNILVERAISPKAGLFNTFQRVITPNYAADSPRLIILDCGLVTSLDDRCRENLRDVFYSVLTGNGEMAAQYILEHSSHRTPDPEGFKRSMKNIVKYHLRNPFNINVSTIVMDLFSAMTHHQVKQDSSFSSVILSILMIEDLGRRLNPNMNIFTEILPFVIHHVIID